MFTPSYGAPEQFDKKRGATGPWTDVFAFALVLVEVVSGRPALEGEGVFALYHASSDPVARPTLRARGVAVPEGVDRVIEKALHPEPLQRYPDLGSFWQALEAAMVEAGISPVSAAPVDPARLRVGAHGPGDRGAARPAHHHQQHRHHRALGQLPPRRGYGAAIAVAMAALAGAGGVYLARGRTRQAPDPAVSSAVPAAAVAASAPVSTNPAAAAQYRDAMQAWHDGAQDRAIRIMEQAIVLDPELGAGQLRLALWHFMAGSAGGKQVEGREHFQVRACSTGTRWASWTSGLVNAAEPYMRQPWDLDELEQAAGGSAAPVPRGTGRSSSTSGPRTRRASSKTRPSPPTSARWRWIPASSPPAWPRPTAWP